MFHGSVDAWGEGPCIFDIIHTYKKTHFAQVEENLFVEHNEPEISLWPFAMDEEHAKKLGFETVLDGMYLFKKTTWEKVKDEPNELLEYPLLSKENEEKYNRRKQEMSE